MSTLNDVDNKNYGGAKKYGVEKNNGVTKFYRDGKAYKSSQNYRAEKGYVDGEDNGYKKSYRDNKTYSSATLSGANKNYRANQNWRDSKSYRETKNYRNDKSYRDNKNYRNKKSYGDNKSYSNRYAKNYNNSDNRWDPARNHKINKTVLACWPSAIQWQNSLLKFQKYKNDFYEKKLLGLIKSRSSFGITMDHLLFIVDSEVKKSIEKYIIILFGQIFYSSFRDTDWFAKWIKSNIDAKEYESVEKEFFIKKKIQCGILIFVG